jgi:hypothetical protein
MVIKFFDVNFSQHIVSWTVSEWNKYSSTLQQNSVTTLNITIKVFTVVKCNRMFQLNNVCDILMQDLL